MNHFVALLIAACFFVVPRSLAQQDSVFMKEGRIFTGKIEKAGTLQIILRPEEGRFRRHIAKRDVHHIVYANGSVQRFTKHPIVYPHMHVFRPFRGRNILLASPFNLVALNRGAALGGGLYYERLIGEQKDFGIVAPISLVTPAFDFNYAAFVATPGILYHISGVDAHGDICIGPSVLLSNLGAEGTSSYRDNRFVSGILLHTRMNFRKGQGIFSLAFNIGPTFGNHSGNPLFFQFGVGFGGAF